MRKISIATLVASAQAEKYFTCETPDPDVPNSYDEDTYVVTGAVDSID